MPTYLYQEILPDGSPGESFEIHQGMSDPPLKKHPVDGRPIEKIFARPNLTTQYTESSNKKLLNDKNVTEKGFTRYEKDKLTGKYHKTAGSDKNAPDIIEGTAEDS